MSEPRTGMMISPAMWRKYLQPRLKRMIRMTKEANPQVLAIYHSDGDIRAILPVLLDCGMDILNPIQPECMNPAEIYRAYHDRVVLWGTIGTQTTMPFGTPDDVRTKARKCWNWQKKEGRLILAPTHLLEPEVPLEKSGCSDGNRAELLLPLKSGGKPLRFSEIQPVLFTEAAYSVGSCRFLSETVWKNTADV